MNRPSYELLQKATTQAIYNIYSYLIYKYIPYTGETLQSVLKKLNKNLDQFPESWSVREKLRLKIIENAVASNISYKSTKICDVTYSKDGLTAIAFIDPEGKISVVYKGTGNGEWIDNGEGLSGIPNENKYFSYFKEENLIFREIVKKDYATDQQAEALNWFLKVCAKNNWKNENTITVSGHSKGGNKAQFIAINSDLVDFCFSFDGQGFSPEALDSLKKQYPKKYEARNTRIYSFATDNDYVNVLGKRLMPKENIYYFKGASGLHYMESLLCIDSKFRPSSAQGKLSAFMETISDELMDMKPNIRKYATLGVMNIFQKYFGKGTPVNDDKVSFEVTLAGVAITAAAFLNQFKKLYTK